MSAGSNLDNKLKSTSQLLNRAKNSGKRVLDIPLEKIEVDTGQVRKVFDQESLKGLAVSLKNQGQIEPIVVSPIGKDGKYQIQKGERRFRAAQIAGMESIEAIINETANLDELMLSMQQLVENIQREDLMPHEISSALCKMKESGLASKAIADSIGKSQAWVSQHLAIANARGCVLELIEAGKASDTTTINELIKLYDENREACNAYCNQVLATEGVLAVRAEVRKLRQEGVIKNDGEPKKQQYKTVRVKVPTDIIGTLERIAERINQNPDSPYGQVEVSDVLRILTESLSQKGLESGDKPITGISLQIV